MIDYLIKFASEADAKADPVVGAYCSDDSRCIPGVLVWQPSADTTATDANGNSIVTHHPITDAGGTPYWYIMISTPTLVEALFNAALLTTDRDAANAGQPFVLGSVLTNADLASYMLQPQFAGSSYPFGAPQ